MISSLLTMLVIGFIAIVVLGVAVTAFGMLVGLAAFALKIGVLVGIGWLAVKLFAPKKQKQLSEEDRKWLES